MDAFFSLGLGIGRKFRKDEGLEQTICKVFRVRISEQEISSLLECFLQRAPSSSLKARYVCAYSLKALQIISEKSSLSFQNMDMPTCYFFTFVAIYILIFFESKCCCIFNYFHFGTDVTIMSIA